MHCYHAGFDGFKRFEWQWFLREDKCGIVLDNNVPELFVKFELFNFDRRLVIHGFFLMALLFPEKNKLLLSSASLSGVGM